MSESLSDLKLRAEIARIEAEREHHLAEARSLDVLTRSREADLADELLNYETRRMDHAQTLAEDINHGVYYFNMAVASDTVKLLRTRLNRWHRTHPGEPFEIVFNSPGGSVFAGLDAGDIIDWMRDQGHHVTTRVAGMACSMAGILLQHGDTRIIGRNSWLHLHAVSTGAVGKVDDLEDAAELAKRLTQQAWDLYASRAKEAVGVRSMSATEIYEWVSRHERWLSPDEALDKGFVDLVE